MKIYINNLKVQSISSIGSLNIGKTILCQNRSTTIEGVAAEPETPGAQVTPAGIGPQEQLDIPPALIQTPQGAVPSPATAP